MLENLNRINLATIRIDRFFEKNSAEKVSQKLAEILKRIRKEATGIPGKLPDVPRPNNNPFANMQIRILEKGGGGAEEEPGAICIISKLTQRLLIGSVVSWGHSEQVVPPADENCKILQDSSGFFRILQDSSRFSQRFYEKMEFLSEAMHVSIDSSRSPSIETANQSHQMVT